MGRMGDAKPPRWIRCESAAAAFSGSLGAGVREAGREAAARVRTAQQFDAAAVGVDDPFDAVSYTHLLDYLTKRRIKIDTQKGKQIKPNR